MRLVADVEVQDDLLDARLLDLLQRLDDLLGTPEQDRAVGEVFLLHVPENLGDLDEVLHGRRRILGLVRDGADHAVIEVVELGLAAVVLALVVVGDEDEIAAHRAAGLPALARAGLAVRVDRLVEPAEDHAGGERGVDDVEPALRRHVEAGLRERGDIERQRLLHRPRRDLHLGDVVVLAFVRPRPRRVPGLEQDVDPLFEDLRRGEEVGAEGAVLLAVVAAPGGEVDAPAGEQIEARPHLGDVHRMMQGQHRDRRREAHVLGLRGDVGQQDVGPRVHAQ